MPASQPIFNSPGVVIALIAVLGVVHAGLTYADNEVFAALALIPGRLSEGGNLLPGGETARVSQFLTHMFLHADLTHLLFNSAWLLIFGTIVARRVGAVRFLAFFVVSGIGAALAFTLANQGLLQPMIGASGAVSGLFAGALRLIFPAVDMGGLWILEKHPDHVRALSVAQSLRDRRMLSTIAVLVVMNLALATGFGGLFSDNPIAWEAHLGGFFTGLALFSLFDRRSPHAEHHSSV